jgi:glycosyltransferase involved in cell wall biosynthesis
VKTPITWIIDSLGPGGAERITMSLLEQFDRGIFDIRVCVLQIKQGNPVAHEIERIGIPVDFVPVPYLRHPANLPRLLRYLRKWQPKLIHTQLEFSDVLGCTAGKILGIPCVSTQHTVGVPEGGSEFWRNELMWTCLRHCCNKVIAVSESTRQFHKQMGRLGNDKIITIYNGINLSPYRALSPTTKNEKRRLLNIPIDGMLITTVAVLRELKGIQYMIEAMPKLLDAAPDVYYLIVGDGEYGQSLRELVASHQLGNRVLFAGQRSDIPEILAASDLFVLPSLTEALPTVLMEAMAAMKPIVASSVGGIPEMINNRINGMLVSPENPLELADTCLQVLLDKNMAETMGRNGFDIAREKFDIQDQVRKLTNLYQELITNAS